MCIALLSTAHPRYRLILLDNRDEFLSRPTAAATFWPQPNSHILGGRDLLRPEQGTWLGVTRSGRVAVLTNFREEGPPPPPSAISRGAIVRDFLADASGRATDEYVRDLLASGEVGQIGGFSLVCGKVGEKLAVVSNRMAKEEGAEVPWICGSEVITVGLSNATFGDRGWKKVTDGEKLMAAAIHESTQNGESEEDLMERFLQLLSTDTLPRLEHANGEGGLETYLLQLRNTILVPPLGRKDPASLPADEIAAARKKDEKVEPADQNEKTTPPQLGASGLYGTQKQTVLLADHSGRVRFFERTLFDNDSNPVPHGKGDVDVSFQIED